MALHEEPVTPEVQAILDKIWTILRQDITSDNVASSMAGILQIVGATLKIVNPDYSQEFILSNVLQGGRMAHLLFAKTRGKN